MKPSFPAGAPSSSGPRHRRCSDPVARTGAPAYGCLPRAARCQYPSRCVRQRSTNNDGPGAGASSRFWPWRRGQARRASRVLRTLGTDRGFSIGEVDDGNGKPEVISELWSARRHHCGRLASLRVPLAIVPVGVGHGPPPSRDRAGTSSGLEVTSARRHGATDCSAWPAVGLLVGQAVGSQFANRL